MSEKDVYVIENMIRLLNRCLLMNVKSFNFIEANKIFEDINKCKKELKRLKEAKERKENAPIQ